MKKKETLSIRLSEEDKKFLTEICEPHGAKPGTYAAAAISEWLNACRKVGKYVTPIFSSTVYTTGEEEKAAAIGEVASNWMTNHSDKPLIIKPSKDGTGAVAYIKDVDSDT